MIRKKALKKDKLSTAISIIRPKNDKLDAGVMNIMLSWIISQIQSTGLYSEDQWVLEDYDQMQYAITAIHSYLYDQKQSNLNNQDAKILAAYLVEKTKRIKSIIDKL